MPQTILSDHQVSHLVDKHITLDTNPVDIPIDEAVVVENEETCDLDCQGDERISYVLPPRTTRGVLLRDMSWIMKQGNRAIL